MSLALTDLGTGGGVGGSGCGVGGADVGTGGGVGGSGCGGADVGLQCRSLVLRYFFAHERPEYIEMHQPEQLLHLGLTPRLVTYGQGYWGVGPGLGCIFIPKETVSQSRGVRRSL